MKVQFKYPRTIDGKQFVPGIYELENKMLDHWFFQGLMEQGHVVLLDEPLSVSSVNEETEKEEKKPARKKRSS